MLESTQLVELLPAVASQGREVWCQDVYYLPAHSTVGVLGNPMVFELRFQRRDEATKFLAFWVTRLRLCTWDATTYAAIPLLTAPNADADRDPRIPVADDELNLPPASSKSQRTPKAPWQGPSGKPEIPTGTPSQAARGDKADLVALRGTWTGQHDGLQIVYRFQAEGRVEISRVCRSSLSPTTVHVLPRRRMPYNHRRRRRLVSNRVLFPVRSRVFVGGEVCIGTNLEDRKPLEYKKTREVIFAHLELVVTSLPPPPKKVLKKV